MTYSSRLIRGVQATIGVTLTLFNLLQFTSETGSWDIIFLFCNIITKMRRTDLTYAFPNVPGNFEAINSSGVCSEPS